MIHILYKKKTDIHQRLILDFMGLERMEVYKTWEKDVYNEMRKKVSLGARKTYSKRRFGKDKENSKHIQLMFNEFIDWIPTLKGKYLYRFPKVQIPKYNEYAKEIISKGNGTCIVISQALKAFWKTY